MPKTALIDALDQAAMAFGAVNTVLEFTAHPHLRRVSVDTPGGLAPPAFRGGS